MEIKKRDAYYCNLKFLLLFFVVLGHWIEPYIGCAPWIASIYRIIYTVHMPLFIFLSGMFLASGRRTGNRAVRALSCYLVFQTAAVLIGKLSGSPMCLCRPYWHLWYLLSLGLWSCAVGILERWGRLSDRSMRIRLLALLLAVGIGCGAGCLPWAGRNMSLQRTLAFFPYLLAGWLCPEGVFRGRRILGAAALLGFAGLYIRFGSWIPTGFFYQAEPYGALGPAGGSRLRLICYLMGGLFGIGLLALMPERRLLLSRIGTDTLGIYLCHAPLVTLFRLLPLSWPEMVLIGPFASLWLYCLLCQLFRWRGQLYAVHIRKSGRSMTGRVKKYDFQGNI